MECRSTTPCAASSTRTPHREIIGPPPPPLAGDGGHGGECQASTGDGSGPPHPGNATNAGEEAKGGGADGSAGAEQASPQSLGEALRQAVREQRGGELEQLNEDVDLQMLLKAAGKPEPPSGRGRGTGMPTGRLPDRGVDRPPMADEVQLARQYVRRLHQAREVGLKRIDERTPGGRFNPRAHFAPLYVRRSTQIFGRRV